MKAICRLNCKGCTETDSRPSTPKIKANAFASALLVPVTAPSKLGAARFYFVRFAAK